jgi:hypothetical protein
MSIPLFNFTELIAPKPSYLQPHLYKELKSQCAWRDNKSDSIQDQLKYFESFYSKKLENSHVSKEILQDYLNESEKIHHLQMNEEKKSKHIEIDSIRGKYITGSENVSHYLYYLDNVEKQMDVFYFNIQKNWEGEKNEKNGENLIKEINVNYADHLEINLDFDTDVRQMNIPSSRYFQSAYSSSNSENSQIKSNCFFMDMYSIYNLNLSNFENEIKINKFEKLKTLSDFPNSFMSDTMMDKLFVISNSKINPGKNKLTLFDNQFKIVSELNYGDEDINGVNFLNGVGAADGTALKGEFFSHPLIVLLYKQSGQTILTDFRVKYFKIKINILTKFKIYPLPLPLPIVKKSL